MTHKELLDEAQRIINSGKTATQEQATKYVKTVTNDMARELHEPTRFPIARDKK